MSATKRLVTPSVIDCDTTAVRLAYTFVAADIGSLVNDFENGNTYICVSAGSGAACMKNLTASSQFCHNFSLNDFREVSSSSDVGNITANGGLLASDTTPILRGDANESWEISWATGNVDEVGCQISLPCDASGNALLDGTRDMYLLLGVYSGTSDAATFTVGTSWDGGTQVSDTADDSSSKSATVHIVTATIAAADIPDSPKRLSIELTPGTHGTDTVQLVSARLVAYRK